ncbi:MAG: extracellular solute-binding protein [Sphaerochaetaceae bacterium]|jgi:multiple sugar transport system substrate-binding protein|nr:extracellular solute-binding protein [Sphaerochaetaceae bacterium]MDD4762817.1 extracellular solute-binding protein [Sphaerochaetaceae bacterium]NLO59670.1 extracellular solute-binding protein [Spirochaetales bacterium]
MKKFFVIMFVVLTGSALLFAAGVPESATQKEDTVIRWAYWGSGERVTISQQAIELYESRNPGVKINPEVSGGAGDHFVKVDTQLAGGNGPDIIQMGGNIYDYANVLLPLDVYAGKVLDVDVIDPSAVASGTIDGELKGVSTGVTMPSLVINKTLIQNSGAPLPPKSMTYPEFREYLVMLKGKLPKGVYPMQDIGVTSNNSTPFGYWTRYNGTPLYDAKTKTTSVSAADAQKYLELFKDYRDNGLVPPAEIAAGYAENNADTAAIIAGKVAISYLYTNQLSGYQAATTDELDLIEFPGAAATKALWQAPSQFYTVNKDSKNPEETVKFINFLVNDPDAAKILGNNRGASASATARAAGASSEADQKILDYMDVSGPHSSLETDHVPNDTEFNSTLFLIYQRVAFGRNTPKEGGQEIAQLLQRLIEK